MEKTNLWRLHNLAEAYGKRPSEIMPTETALSDWQLDEVCLVTGRSIENRLNRGETAFELAPEKNRYASARHKVTKKVRIGPDGTW